MDKKIGTFIIILALILVGASYNVGLKAGAQRAILKIQQSSQTQAGTGITKLLASKTIDVSASTYGVIKNISGQTIVLEKTFEKRESKVFSVPIKQGAKITTEYVLPDNAKEDELVGTITTNEGEIVKLGGRETEVKNIKVGDTAFINLEILPDGSYEGISIRISPANLLSSK